MNALDLTGRRFGRLTVLRRTDEKLRSCYLWECRCDCGSTVLADTHSLTHGARRSCGCLLHDDAAGEKYGQLTAVRYLRQDDKQAVWLWQCDCGNFVEARLRYVRTGNRTSCGCAAEKQRAEQIKDTRKHLTFLCDTAIERVKSDKLPSNNTSGVKGVSYSKAHDCWVARIGFRGKGYNLGAYRRFEDAVAARRRADDEVKLFMGWYEKYKVGETSEPPPAFNPTK